MMTLYEIKSEARDNLKKKWLFSAVIFLIVAIVFFLFVAIFMSIFPIPTSNYTLSLGDLGLPIWILLIYPAVRLSFSNIYLKITKSEKPKISDCYSGFKLYWKVTLLSFVRLLLVLVWLVLAYLSTMLNMIFIGITSGLSQTQMLISSVFLLLFIFLVGVAIWKNVRYNQIFFLLSDNPKMKIRDLIKKSNELMSGNFWKNFLLNLSFFGWNIVVFIGIIVVISPFYTVGNYGFVSVLLWPLLLPFIFVHIYSLVSKAVYYRTLSDGK